MEALTPKIDVIIQNVQSILHEHTQLKQKYLDLAEEKNKLSFQVEKQKATINTLQEKLNHYHTKQANNNDKNNEQLKRIVQQLIDELETCINMINNK